MSQSEDKIARLKKLAQLDFDAGGSYESAHELFNVSVQTCSSYRASDGYLDELDRLKRTPMIRRIKQSAWKLIEGVIQDGNTNREKGEPDTSFIDWECKSAGQAVAAIYKSHSDGIDRGTRTAQWVLEKVKDFGDEREGTGSEASDLLSKIFAAPDALIAENAALKQQIAAILLRLDKLNGTGQAIRDECIPTEYIAPDESHWPSESAYLEHRRTHQ